MGRVSVALGFYHRLDGAHKLSSLLGGGDDVRVESLVEDIRGRGFDWGEHRLFASDYFDAMFTRGMLEADMDRVEIQGLDPAALKILVEYCYSGKLY